MKKSHTKYNKKFEAFDRSSVPNIQISFCILHLIGFYSLISLHWHITLINSTLVAKKTLTTLKTIVLVIDWRSTCFSKASNLWFTFFVSIQTSLITYDFRLGLMRRLVFIWTAIYMLTICRNFNITFQCFANNSRPEKYFL